MGCYSSGLIQWFAKGVKPRTAVEQRAGFTVICSYFNRVIRLSVWAKYNVRLARLKINDALL